MYLSSPKMSNSIPPQDPTAHAAIIDVLRLGGQAVIYISGLWVAIVKIAKPYHEWRKTSLVRTIKDSLAEEIAVLHHTADQQSKCTKQMATFFEDHDLVLELIKDNKSRLDETNGLLDHVFSIERRVDEDERVRINALVVELARRRRERHRQALEIQEENDSNG